MTILSPRSDSGGELLRQLAETPTVSRYVKEKWVTALINEDCRTVLKLVKRSPELLGTTWKGRTALHVGARRGCLDLVEHIMRSFDSERRMSWDQEEIRRKLLDPKSDFCSLLQESFLVAEDPEYHLDALAMAIVNGNGGVIHVLVEGSLLLCASNPLGIKHPDGERTEGTIIAHENDDPGALLRDATIIVLRNISKLRTDSLSSERSAIRENTDTIIKDVTQKFSETSPEPMEVLKRMYKKNRDFNFLPWDSYLFHFTFVSKAVNFSPRLMEQIRREILKRAMSADTLSCLCERQDGQGRTALHVAVDEGTVKHFLALLNVLPDWAGRSQLLSTPDSVGRTPLHRAAAIKNSKSLHHLLGDGAINVNEPLQLWEYAHSLTTETGIDLQGWSKRNRFQGFGYFHFHDSCSALHLAILHRRRKNVEILLEDRCNRYRHLSFPFSRFFEIHSEPTEGKVKRLNLGALQLAALVGDSSIFQLLLKESVALDEGTAQGRELMNSHWNPWAAIHIIAGAGRCNLLSMIMDSEHYDCSVVDLYGNNALHHAVKGLDTVFFDTHLIDHISCEIARDSRKQNANKASSPEESAHRALIERKRCVEILLEAGFDVWSTNYAKQCPYPGSEATAEFLAWWFSKLARETSASQKMYNSAANAISVTAILVATATYVGPFQPPLGYTNNRMFVPGFLKMYVVSETLAFYLAIGSVMVALMASLPVPQESMVDELRRTKKRVTVAVGLLFPSIICLLLDFGSASIAVIGSKNSQRLTIATTCIGGLICVIVSFLFSIRLLRLICYRHPGIKKLFRSVNF